MKTPICSSKQGKTNIVCKIDYVCSSNVHHSYNDDSNMRMLRRKERKEAPLLNLAKLCAL